jgi:hypothetical protein
MPARRRIPRRGGGLVRAGGAALLRGAASGSASGMQAYLDALPAGPHHGTAPSGATRSTPPPAPMRASAFRPGGRDRTPPRGRGRAAKTSPPPHATHLVGRLLDFDAWGHTIDGAKGASRRRGGGVPGRNAPGPLHQAHELPYDRVGGKPRTVPRHSRISFRLAKGRVIGRPSPGRMSSPRLAEAHHAEPIPETEEGWARAGVRRPAHVRRRQASEAARYPTPPRRRR